MVTEAIKPEIDFYYQIQGSIPIDLEKGSFISIERKAPPKIYSLGFQPAKAIPEIAQWFLEKYATPTFAVLEPFAGSGTTLIECLKHGNPSFWLDYQPLSRLICEVKTTRYPLTLALQEATKIIRVAYGQENAPQTVSFANKDFWFQPAVQEGLEILRQLIWGADRETQPILWLAFASTIRKMSNMNEGMILAARRVAVQEIPERSRFDVFKSFQGYIQKTIEALAEWDKVLANSATSTMLPFHDARSISGDLMYDAVLTSPPYINAIDYVWASKFELHWLGLVESDEARLELYTQEIGTERVPSAEVKKLGRTGNSYLDRLIEDIYYGAKYKASKGQNQLRARVVYKYFEDMRQHFSSSYSHLQPGGYYCFSIGDVSKICGVEIPVAEILTEIACDLGFQELFNFHILLKNRRLNVPRNVSWAGTIKHDTVMVLRKPY